MNHPRVGSFVGMPSPDSNKTLGDSGKPSGGGGGAAFVAYVQMGLGQWGPPGPPKLESSDLVQLSFHLI